MWIAVIKSILTTTDWTVKKKKKKIHSKIPHHQFKRKNFGYTSNLSCSTPKEDKKEQQQQQSKCCPNKIFINISHIIQRNLKSRLHYKSLQVSLVYTLYTLQKHLYNNCGRQKTKYFYQKPLLFVDNHQEGIRIYTIYYQYKKYHQVLSAAENKSKKKKKTWNNQLNNSQFRHRQWQ